jgi:tetratricopeptide (TPR) repeat protein
MSLDVNSKVRLTEHSVLIISRTNGATLELRKPGEYLLSTAFRTKKEKGNDKLKRFGAFIYDRVFEKKDRRTIPGAYERGSEAITLLFPTDGKYLNPEITFLWTSKIKLSKCRIIIRDSFNNKVFETDTKDSIYSLNIQELHFSPEQCYSWQVMTEAESVYSSEKCIVIPTDEEREEFKKYEEQFLEENADLESYKYALLAAYYQEMKVVDRTIDFYKKAIESAPEIEEYKILLDDFIKEKGIKFN